MYQNDLLLRAYYNPKELAEELERRSLALYKAKIREEERAEGRQESQREIIINMYKENATLDFISKVTKLSLDKVKEIINNDKAKKENAR